MKQLIRTVMMKVFLAVFAFFTGTFFVLAQDGETSSSTKVTTTRTETQSWYAEPWVWVVGAAVFIIILVALLRGNSTVTKRTTVERSDI